MSGSPAKQPLSGPFSDFEAGLNLEVVNRVEAHGNKPDSEGSAGSSGQPSRVVSAEEGLEKAKKLLEKKADYKSLDYEKCMIDLNTLLKWCGARTTWAHSRNMVGLLDVKNCYDDSDVREGWTAAMDAAVNCLDFLVDQKKKLFLGEPKSVPITGSVELLMSKYL